MTGAQGLFLFLRKKGESSEVRVTQPHQNGLLHPSLVRCEILALKNGESLATQGFRVAASFSATLVGGDGGIRTHGPAHHRSNDFESFPPCDFWWKLSEDGSTQRKPKSCGILRILASVFRFYLNPQGFPSSSHFCPELWPEDRTRIELDARLGVFTPIPFHKNANHHFD